MRAASICVAAVFAVGGVVPAALLALLLGAVHVARSPDRLVDAAYVAVFCGLGYAVG